MVSVFNMLSTRLPPKCTTCGGALKPDVVFCGESLPAAVLDEAVKETKACDLFLVVGSSLVVQPAAGLPAIAKRNGAMVVIINKDATPLDAMADMVIHSGASEVLGEL
jgi:NAD-dependent deacetylase